MNQPISRRSLVAALALSPVLLPLVPRAGAQGTSPFAGLGLPELNLTVTASAIEGMPASIEAGRYLVTVTVPADAGTEGGGVQFVRPVDGRVDEMTNLFAPAMANDAIASPAGNEPEPTMSDEDFSTLMFESSFTGGAFAEAGATTQVVLDLEPGGWLAAGGFDEPQPPVSFEVTGTLSSSLPDPSAGATIEMADYQFTIGAGQLVKGTQTIKVENTGAQPHHIYMGRSTVPVADADLEAIAMEPDAHLIHVISIQTISAGGTIWLPVTLSSGPHVMLCYFPSLEDGAPHFAHGMHLVFEIEE